MNCVLCIVYCVQLDTEDTACPRLPKSSALLKVGIMNRDQAANDTIEIPTLPVDDLYDRRRNRDTARLKAYNTLLERIYHRIRVVSRMPTHPTDIIYTIPPFIIGLPRLDLEDCVVYLVYQLRNNGFKVNFTYPNMLHINWKHHERNYIVNESPILQAMLATTPEVPAAPAAGSGPVAPNRKKRGQDSPRPLMPVQPLQQQMSAVEYSPPSNFFQAVERPAAEGRQFGGDKSALMPF